MKMMPVKTREDQHGPAACIFGEGWIKWSRGMLSGSPALDDTRSEQSARPGAGFRVRLAGQKKQVTTTEDRQWVSLARG